MLADDMAVPIYNVPKAVAAIEEIAGHYDICIPAYGHAGDGNLHTKVLMDPTSPEHWKQAEEAVGKIYDAIFALGGTTTGEHGIGITKAPLFHKERGAAVKVMKAIKKALDPHNIMNPGKIMDWEEGFVTHLRYPEAPVKKKGLHLDRHLGDMVKCTLCGYCKGVCPAFDALQWDSATARGKMILSYGMVTGEIDIDRSVAERLYQCVLCGDCARRCPSSIDAPAVIQAARADLVDAGLAYDAHKAVVDNILRIGNIYGEAEFPMPRGEGDTAVFLGCQYGFRMNKTKRYFQILAKLGMKPYASKVICCGFPMMVLGFRKAFEEHKKRFLDALGPLPDRMVTFCPSCGFFLKEEYGIEATNILPVILERIESSGIGQARIDGKVTYHDPCDLSRRLKITAEPRKILKKMGIDIVEMPFNRDKSHCCGGGGGILMSDGEVSGRISLARVEEAASTGADIIATSCPTCETVLRKAAAGYKARKIVVREMSDLLWESLK
jgi:Fe-S oxidoreductase